MALTVVVALAVDTAPEASFGKDFLVDLALLAQLHLLLEDIDLPSQFGWNLAREFFFPAQAVFHKNLLRNEANYELGDPISQQSSEKKFRLVQTSTLNVVHQSAHLRLTQIRQCGFFQYRLHRAHATRPGLDQTLGHLGYRPALRLGF